MDSSSPSENEIEVLPQGPANHSSSKDEIEVLHQTTAPVRRDANEAGTVPPTETGTVPPTEAGTAPPTEAGTVPNTETGTTPPTEAGTAPPTTEATGPAQVPEIRFEPPTVAEVIALFQQDNLYAQMLQETLDAEMAYPNPDRLLIAQLNDSFSSDEDYAHGQDDDDDDFFEHAAMVNVVRNSPSMAFRVNRNYHSEYDSDSDEDNQVVYPNGLKVSEINKLRTRKYILLETQALGSGDSHVAGSSSSKRNYHRECIICAVEYSDGDVLRILPCRHEFHSKCVDRWLKRKALCPLCRSVIDKNEL